MSKPKKNIDRSKITNNKLNNTKRSVKITHAEIENNVGFLGTKGKLLKALMEEKKIVREY